ncbi:TonB-dependent receptor [uncultured Porphyromonas sp.]|uniref:SusC/RagA family TonB-linked outer membrane protein n=1 Tax=uncultured Porphyromonas sp. TaxID=159274 RepID=UPI002611EC40|nr:TonB-dependent receptor [uncultured Porphyromonas sp.]
MKNERPLSHRARLRSTLAVSLLTICTLPLAASAAPEQEPSSSPLTLAQVAGKVRGRIVDAATGEPIIGASIHVKGNKRIGAVSDMQGGYTLSAAPGVTLVISYIGYETLEVRATEKEQVIQLTENSKTLSELVVVGYTTQRKESLTGAMISLKDTKLKDMTTPSVSNLLNGKAPGVYVAPGSGQPGSSAAVVIRGQATLNGNTRPLWVIDGVIVGDDPGQLNPQDIEGLTILKDAASTAIYGSAGANGVVVVTTKSSRSGKLRVSASVRAGLSRLNNGNLRMMNGAELYDYFASTGNASTIPFPRWKPALRNDNFDWWALATRTGISQDYNLTIQGGSETMNSLFSLGYYDEKGAVKGFDYKRYNFRLKTAYKPLDWLTIRPMISGAMQTSDDREYSVSAMYSMLPWDSPYDADGKPVPHQYSGWVNSNSTNYIRDLQWNHAEGRNYEFMGNLDFDARITPWLTFSSVNNYKYVHSTSHGYQDPRSSGGESVQGRITEYHGQVARRYTNQKLLTSNSWGLHNLNGLLAYEFNDYWGKSTDVYGTGFVPGFEVLDITAKPERAKGGIAEWAVQSVFANARYSYDNRYLVEGSIRRDGASNLGSRAKYGTLFSISGGWNIHRESWFGVKAFDQLKLRASYGSAGNRPSALYPQYDLYSIASNYNGQPGMLISQIGNRDLTWERTYTAGIGLDASLWENRLRLTLDLYSKKTDNILYNVPVTSLTGVTHVYRNIGKMDNRGIEVAIGGDLIRTKDITWSLDLNIGHNANKLTDIFRQYDPSGQYIAKPVIIGDGSGIAGSATRILEIGSPIDTYYMPQWAGVDPEDGRPLWYKEDADGKKVTTKNYAEAKYYKLGSAAPKVFGGITTSLRWREFDLSATFGYALGGQIYNYSRQELDSDLAYTDRNQMALQKGWSRWQKKGDIATHPRALYNNKDNGNKASSRYLENNSFFKLRTLTLGYNLSLPQLKIQTLRIYLNAENLLTFTKYSGVDPELPASDGSVMGTTGISVYPPVRRFVLGFNLSL